VKLGLELSGVEDEGVSEVVFMVGLKSVIVGVVKLLIQEYPPELIFTTK
jgi:hypothetical protein